MFRIIWMYNVLRYVYIPCFVGSQLLMMYNGDCNSRVITLKSK